MTSRRCKSCRWWERAPEHAFSRCVWPVELSLQHDLAVCEQRLEHADGFGISLGDSGLDEIQCGPDFGCVHWEERDE